MGYKVFLDDERQPQQVISWMKGRIGNLSSIYNESWEVVKNFDMFVKAIEENYESISHVSFDHDLADIRYNPKTARQSFSYLEKTGYDCAVWLREFYKVKNMDLLQMFVHSMNTVGVENIIKAFK